MKRSTKLTLIVIVLVSLVIGFFGGMEYKAYQVRSALRQAFSQVNIPATSASQTQNVAGTTSTQNFIDELIGQNIVLQTLSVKVISSKRAKLFREPIQLTSERRSRH